MTELNDPNSNDLYVDLRVHFSSELAEDSEGGGTSYLIASKVTRENMFNLTDDDLEGLDEMFTELPDTPISEALAETICYGGELELD